jgi:hypothetical protein
MTVHLAISGCSNDTTVGLDIISKLRNNSACISSGMESIPARGGSQFMVTELIIKTFLWPSKIRRDKKTDPHPLPNERDTQKIY